MVGTNEMESQRFPACADVQIITTENLECTIKYSFCPVLSVATLSKHVRFSVYIYGYPDKVATLHTRENRSFFKKLTEVKKNSRALQHIDG